MVDIPRRPHRMTLSNSGQSLTPGEMSQSEMLGTFFKASDNMRHSLFKEGDFWNRAKYFFRAHSVGSVLAVGLLLGAGTS